MSLKSSSSRVEDMIFDVGPDDDKELLKKRSVQQWDQKKRKFVTVSE